MNFHAEPAPPRGVALDVLPGIRRVVADNPSPMTYHGTNTYLLDWEGGVAVLDPGPDDARHVQEVLRLAGAPVRALLLTHGHHDHLGAVAAMRAATGAPVLACRGSASAPEVALDDGDRAGEWRALHTPGHAPDHVCFLRADGVAFSGDHVMGWSSTVVGEPDGDMGDYFRSLERLIAAPASVYLPGHGPAVPDPVAYARALLRHRELREAEILAGLGAVPQSVPALVGRIYPDLAPTLQRAAARNVLAHLQKLRKDRRARQEGEDWVRAG